MKHTGPGCRAVVAAGAGHIGHYLVGALQDRGDDALVIDDLSGEVVNH